MYQISCSCNFKRLLLLTGVIFSSLYTPAQLCTGSLGDPVVNITFGIDASGDPSIVPPGSYTYTAATCPNDGFYTITKSTSGCFNNSWHTVNADHTGNGNFMLVNASVQPSDFFVATLTNLCPNTTYEFSAWIMNVLISPSGIEPDITFKIETPAGVLLNQFNTGSMTATPQPVWKQYGFFFTTTVGNPTIILRMTNNAPGGLGNDLALDDITFRPCGPVISTAIQANSNTIKVCVADQLDYVFTGNVSPGFLSPVLQWQVSTDSGKIWKDIPGANALSYTRQSTSSGNYWYRLTANEAGNGGLLVCRIGSNVLTITVHPKPAISAGPDRVLIAGVNATLAATAAGTNLVFAWSPPDFLSSTTILNPTVAPDRDVDYLLSAVSQEGCTNEDRVLVKVITGIFVPTAFTPNNDGKNDSWRIPYLDPLLGATVSVFNRNGEIVYQTSGAEVNWNGTYKGLPQSSGTFVYLIQFKEGLQDLKGTVSLIR